MWYFIVVLFLYPIIYVLIEKKRLGLYWYAQLKWRKLRQEEKNFIRGKLNKSVYWDAEDDFAGFPVEITIFFASLLWIIIPFILLAKWLAVSLYKLLGRIIKEKDFNK